MWVVLSFFVPYCVISGRGTKFSRESCSPFAIQSDLHICLYNRCSLFRLLLFIYLFLIRDLERQIKLNAGKQPLLSVVLALPPFPLMSLVRTPRGLRKEGGRGSGVSGMPGISDCPPLSLCLPAALPGKWEGSGQTDQWGGSQNTHTHTLTKCAKWVQGLHINLGRRAWQWGREHQGLALG